MPRASYSHGLASSPMMLILGVADFVLLELFDVISMHISIDIIDIALMIILTHDALTAVADMIDDDDYYYLRPLKY